MTSPITLAAKDPNERLAYSWTPQDGDTIASGLTITVTDGTATIDGAPTQIDGNRTARFNLIGGADGENAVITARATTASGDIVEQTILIPIRDSAAFPTELTLDQVKRHLHILHSDDDAQLEDLIRQSAKAARRFVGDDAADDAEEDLIAAQVIWVRWRYYSDEEVELDEIHNLPRPFVALAGPYRTPTVA